MTALLLQGDARRVPLGDKTVQCIITSPPYFGLRSYLAAGHPDKALEIGSEKTLAAYIETLVAVFGECKRVLRDDGTLWIVEGDGFANIGHPKGNPGNGKAAYASQEGKDMKWLKGGNGDGLKHKDLMGLPWRLAFALQDDGWYLRSDCIWSKPNPMPESVTDRPTKSHEYIFLLAKQEHYFYDAIAIQEPAKVWEGQAGCFERTGEVSQHVIPGQSAAQHRPNRNGKNAFRGQGAHRDVETGHANRDGRDMQEVGNGAFRNRRSVWTVATSPYKESHFATFPPKLIEPMVLAGTSARGACEHCGAPWKRVTENSPMVIKHSARAAIVGRTQTSGTMVKAPEHNTIGWRPTCRCPNNTGSAHCLILDPFAGASTTGLVAIKHNRDFVGLELNMRYIEMSHRRLSRVQPVLMALA